MNLLTVYLRREPTTDDTVWKYAPTVAKRKRDIVAYRDKACNTRFARWPWFSTSKPRHGSKVVVLNCWKWSAVWLAEKTNKIP